MAADFLLDSDVVIWHLRGRASVVGLILALARKGRIGLSAITRAEVLLGMREPERELTLLFLDSCETLPVTAATADRAGEIVRTFRTQGITLSLPDSLIAATALIASIPLYTCNPRHYPSPELDLRNVPV
ncbi:MAG TPA: type II toxin-antitoxin system VapC family toxin [Thermoanaerobaculia bacterium]|nr:type II toxin-antitoxin system VapC family toxin [Thermoanaerobaculia bacterium]